MSATPEAQAVVVAKALKTVFPRTRTGRKRWANAVVIGGAHSHDRGRIRRIATEYSHGFDLDIRYANGYFTIFLHEKDPQAKAPSWREEKEKTHPLPDMWEG